MSLIKKPWGHKIEILNTGLVIVDLLHISPGGYCSIHSHKYLHNKFYLLPADGGIDDNCLVIRAYEKTTDSVKKIQELILDENNRETTVGIKILHQFFNPCKWPIKVIETSYTMELDIDDDIERFVDGGILNV